MDTMTAKMASDKLYLLDGRNAGLLRESAPLSAKWAATECKTKRIGGMEEWAKENHHEVREPTSACDWYHGTWQYLRLLNMVAVPPWYGFYNDALSRILREKPEANVFICACADYGMLATLHEAIEYAGARPKITVYDICGTPLVSCQWYAKRHGLEVECVCDNILTTPRLPHGSFDLIVTDEFLTVLKLEYKPQILTRWAELLKPGGSVVTTAMLGGPTTPELREGYAQRAQLRLKEEGATFQKLDVSPQDLQHRFNTFANYHTRHMLAHEGQLRELFKNFQLAHFNRIVTPGECVNPTSSFEIVATLPKH